VLFGVTKHGVKPPYGPPGYASDMPAFDGILSDEDIWAVLAYIAGHWSAKERAYQAQVTREDAGRRR
jgi:mono/diheme cytochrome c family protein